MSPATLPTPNVTTPPSAEELSKRLSLWKQHLGTAAMLPLHRLFGDRVREAFGILMYHRVAENVRGIPAPTWNVTPGRLRRQLSGLLKRGYEPWPLRRALAHHRQSSAVPRNAFVVTFDDGYANNCTQALPILRELNVPATVFLATSFLNTDKPFSSDDWSGAGDPRVPRDAWLPLTNAQCETLLDSGLIELGAHTHTHGDFRDRPDALREELGVCLEELHRRFGIGDATFAFPYGTRHLGYSGPILAQAAREAGMLCALTTEAELVTPHTDPFEWGRFTAENHDTAATLAAKLGGWFSFARDAWRRARGRTA